MDETITTSKKLGFTVCGMLLKDPVTGNTKQKVGKSKPPKNVSEAEEYLQALFMQGKEDYDIDAIKFVIAEVKKMLKYFTNDNEHIIRGMSVFIVIDSAQKAYACKLIDLVSFEELPKDKLEERDQGVIKGLVTL